MIRDATPRFLAAALVAAAAFVACVPPLPEKTLAPPPAPTFAEIYSSIIVPHCSGSECHNPGTQLDVTFATPASAYQAIHERVLANNHAESPFYQLLDAGTMPLGGPRLSDADLSKIAAWIDAGAMPGDLPTGGTTGTGGAGGARSSGAGGTATGASGSTGLRPELGPRGPGTTGTAGSGGGPTCSPPRCLPQAGCSDLTPPGSAVSSFVDGCGDVLPVDGRDGVWFVYATGGTSTIEPSPDETFRVACNGANGSCFAGCIRGSLSGSGYPTAGIGFTARRDSQAYDASSYRGVAFYLYVDSIPPNAGFRFHVPLVADQVPANGGTCATNCYDSYQLPLVPAASGWMRYEMDFDQLTQMGWGPREAWDPTTVLSVQWVISSPVDTIPDLPFFYCVDDVSFVPR